VELLIKGDYQVEGQKTGLAVGLFSTNDGQPESNTFQAIFDEIEITAEGDSSSTVLYRVNAGGEEIAAIDGGLNWSADTVTNNSAFLLEAGSNALASFNVQPGNTVAPTTPGNIFQTERWDGNGGSEMQWAFETPVAGIYEVRLFMGNGYSLTSSVGQRVFDVEIEGNLFSNLDNVDLSGQFGHLTGGMISNFVLVDDGILNLEFIHGVENPLINGIEIIQLDEVDDTPTGPVVSIINGSQTATEGSQIQISLATDVTVPHYETVNVTFEIIPGTATPGEDYEYEGGTLDPQTGIYTGTAAIAGSSSDATFQINLLDDAISEDNEAFTVKLTEVSSNAQIGNADASVTIEDNDVASNDNNVVAAINAGGSALTQDGIDFLADQSFVSGRTFTDGISGNGTQPVFDDTIYETERYGGV